MARRCKYGKLKRRIGRRVCKVRRGGRKVSSETKWRRARAKNNQMDRTFGRRR